MSNSYQGQPLVPIPEGFGLPFYYSSLFNIGVFYLADLEVAQSYLAGTSLLPAIFDGKALVSYNFQHYTGQFPNGSSITQEIELNILAYPETLATHVAEVTYEQYILGEEQSKILGNHRVHVPCDNDGAIAAGVELFGEPKFKTTFTINIPSLNDPSVTSWMFTCNDPNHPNSKEDAIYTVEANLQGLAFVPGNFSPITEYGQHEGKLIGCRWNILQPNQVYFLQENEQDRITLSYGTSDHQMGTDLRKLLDNAQVVAVRTIASPPAAVQARAYYP